MTGVGDKMSTQEDPEKQANMNSPGPLNQNSRKSRWPLLTTAPLRNKQTKNNSQYSSLKAYPWKCSLGNGKGDLPINQVT